MTYLVADFEKAGFEMYPLSAYKIDPSPTKYGTSVAIWVVSV